MVVDLRITNAKVFMQGRILESGIAADDGAIIKIGKATHLPQADKNIDANGMLLVPGLVDPHVHLRDMQFAYKEDFCTGTSAAAVGGFTTVLDMPNTPPITDSAERLREKKSIASRLVVVNVGFYASFPRSLDEIDFLVEEGAVAFKVHLLKKWTELNIDDFGVLKSAVSKAGSLGKLVAFHAEDRDTIEPEILRFKNQGRSSAADFLAAHSEESEWRAVSKIINLSSTQAHLHVCHVSSERSVSMIKDARRSGAKITVEVTPHHMLLDSSALVKRGTEALTEPPIRFRTNNHELFLHLVDGSIDIIASDHAPHSIEEKRLSTVWDAPPGIAGLETVVPLLLTKVNLGEISLTRFVEAVSSGPATLFKLKTKGQIWEKYDADFALIDLYREGKIDASRFKSKAKFSPFDGMKVRGSVAKTFVNGMLVMEDREVYAKPGSGSILGA